MRDRELYSQILGIGTPWQVVDVELSVDFEKVKIHVSFGRTTVLSSPRCDVWCLGMTSAIGSSFIWTPVSTGRY